MKLPEIAIPRHVARRHFLDYRRAIRTRAGKDDRTLMIGYRALAQGRRVINGAETITQGGLGPDRLPRLAIVRADAERCFVAYWSGGSVTFTANHPAQPTRAANFWSHRVQRSLIRRFGPATLPAYAPNELQREGEARVPMVPPRLRPIHPLRNYFILWEATWSRIAPKDPVLLKDIGGGLYIVLATWDLTELERSVLGIRG